MLQRAQEALLHGIFGIGGVAQEIARERVDVIQVRQRFTVMPIIHGFSGREGSQRRRLRKTRRKTSWVTSSASCRWCNSRTHSP